MVAATQQQQQQQPQPQQQRQPASTKTSAEEEALKRNTDCVYFLASPLTCKKGSECEYRHSEYARVNPRDCYFWLNGNCLNPKCGFRHPPLDGLLGTQGAPASSAVSSSQTVVAPATHASYNSVAPFISSKQAVPCIFFQKGHCLKGDRCAFFHGPNPTSNKAPQATAASPATEARPLKKGFAGLEKCAQQQKVPPANVSKVFGVPSEANLLPKVETTVPRNVVGTERNVPSAADFGEEFPRHKGADISSVANGGSVGRSSRMHQAHTSDEQSFHTGKETDEFMRETSPGFDVLVDDELRDSDYYHGDDQYGRTSGNDGRNVGDYDMGRSANYDVMADVDGEIFHDIRGYDSFDHVQGQYGWDQNRASTERVSMGLTNLERRVYTKGESPEGIDESDLRYRLSKHRRVNGLRSVVSHDPALENHLNERGYQGSSRRESHHLPVRESSLNSRLRGRIKLPGRSPVNGTDLHSEKEMERGQIRGHLSPGRPQVSSHQGRLRDRIKGRVEMEYDNMEVRNPRGLRVRREIADENNTDFRGPKSLAELKNGKNGDNKEHQALGKRKKLEDHQKSEGDLSFEGPMPLSEILKRKRQAGAAAFGSAISSVNKEESDQKRGVLSSTSKRAADSKEVSKPAVEDKSEVAHSESSQLPNVSQNETEEGLIVDEGMEDNELEADEQRDGEEYYYEQGEEGEYNYDDAENVDPEEEYVEEEVVEEEEDGDDFAKKIGVMLS